MCPRNSRKKGWQASRAAVEFIRKNKMKICSDNLDKYCNTLESIVIDKESTQLISHVVGLTVGTKKKVISTECDIVCSDFLSPLYLARLRYVHDACASHFPRSHMTIVFFLQITVSELLYLFGHNRAILLKNTSSIYRSMIISSIYSLIPLGLRVIYK